MKKAINIIIAAVILLHIVSTVANIITGNGGVVFIVLSAIEIAVGILVLYYNFFGYKKPHGNLLRYILLIFGFALIFSVFLMGEAELRGLIRIVAGALVIYMAGRLNKIEKNKILAIIVLALLAACAVMDVFHITISFEAVQTAATEMPAMDPPGGQNLFIFSILGFCSTPFLWLALFLAYGSRYKEHKEAGLLDKPKA